MTDLAAKFRLQRALSWTPAARTFVGKAPETDEKVAVKVISLGADPQREALARRFEATAGVLESLSHPSLPVVVDYGVTDAGEAYLVTSWFAGAPLTELSLDPGDVLAVMLQVVEALESLSLHGLVHLGLRPENVLVRPDHRAQLTGWGSSLLNVEWQSGQRAVLSVANDYTAPELAATGGIGDALWRADLYSLASMTATLLGADVSTDGDGVSVRFPGALSKQISRAESLRSVLQSCLEQNPDLRPDAYSVFARALQHSIPRERRPDVTATQPMPPIQAGVNKLAEAAVDETLVVKGLPTADELTEALSRKLRESKGGRDSNLESGGAADFVEAEPRLERREAPSQEEVLAALAAAEERAVAADESGPEAPSPKVSMEGKVPIEGSEEGERNRDEPEKANRGNPPSSSGVPAIRPSARAVVLPKSSSEQHPVPRREPKFGTDELGKMIEELAGEELLDSSDAEPEAGQGESRDQDADLLFSAGDRIGNRAGRGSESKADASMETPPSGIRLAPGAEAIRQGGDSTPFDFDASGSEPVAVQDVAHEVQGADGELAAADSDQNVEAMKAALVGENASESDVEAPEADQDAEGVAGDSVAASLQEARLEVVEEQLEQKDSETAGTLDGPRDRRGSIDAKADGDPKVDGAEEEASTVLVSPEQMQEMMEQAKLQETSQDQAAIDAAKELLTDIPAVPATTSSPSAEEVSVEDEEQEEASEDSDTGMASEAPAGYSETEVFGLVKERGDIPELVPRSAGKRQSSADEKRAASPAALNTAARNKEAEEAAEWLAKLREDKKKKRRKSSKKGSAKNKQERWRPSSEGKEKGEAGKTRDTVFTPARIGVAAAAVIAAILVGLLLFGSMLRSEPEMVAEPVPAEDRIAVAEADPEPQPIRPPADLETATALIEEGNWAEARLVLEELGEQVELGLLAPEFQAAYREAQEAVDVGQGQAMLQRLELALDALDVNELRDILRGGSTELTLLAQQPDGPRMRDEAREIVRSVDAFRSALDGGNELEPLERARELEQAYPALANRLDAVRRATSRIEQRVQELVQRGESAQAILLLSRYSELDELSPRLLALENRLQEELDSRARATELVDSADAFGRQGLPHRGLELLESTEIGNADPARVSALLAELRQQLNEMDGEPPQLDLVADDLDLKRGSPLVVEMTASDDYEVSTVRFQLVAEQGAAQELPVDAQGDGKYLVQIPPDLHQGKPVRFWAVALDRSGHQTSLGTQEEPIEVRRKRWFQVFRRRGA